MPRLKTDLASRGRLANGGTVTGSRAAAGTQAPKAAPPPGKAGGGLEANGLARKAATSKKSRAQVAHPLVTIDPARIPRGAADAAVLATQAGKWGTKGAILVSSSTIEAALEKGEGLGNQKWPRWLVSRVAEAYGKTGVLGALSALGALGPVGRNAWNPSYWMKKAGDDHGPQVRFAEELTRLGGPGSDDGPLGSRGPMDEETYARAMKALDGLAEELKAGGLFGAVGNAGALGPVGILGGAGTLGGHGMAQTADGQFTDGGAVRRSITVPYGEGTRQVELVEYYRADFAKKMPDNDTSWMVRGGGSAAGDTFPFQSKKDQWVTLTVVPERLNDTFTLELLDQRGKVVATADSEKLVNFIQVQVPEGQELKARVKLEKSEALPKELLDPVTQTVLAAVSPVVWWFGAMAGTKEEHVAHPYRLICTGTGDYAKDTDRTGAHQTRIDWS